MLLLAAFMLGVVVGGCVTFMLMPDDKPLLP